MGYHSMALSCFYWCRPLDRSWWRASSQRSSGVRSRLNQTYPVHVVFQCLAALGTAGQFGKHSTYASTMRCGKADVAAPVTHRASCGTHIQRGGIACVHDTSVALSVAVGRFQTNVAARMLATTAFVAAVALVAPHLVSVEYKLRVTPRFGFEHHRLCLMPRA